MSNIFGEKRPLGELTYRIRVRYKDGKRDSCWMGGGDIGTIFAASDRAVAESRAREMADEHEDATYHVVPFRVAAKAPPPLRVGDEVLVRGTIARFESEHYVGRLDVCIQGKEGVCWVPSKDIIRAAKESK
jgi:hypothetical protein